MNFKQMTLMLLLFVTLPVANAQRPELLYLRFNSGSLELMEPDPYFANATSGGNLDFHIEGASNQPIILVVGALNPGAATFGTMGQMDIGGPVDPMSGLPTNISVLFDGTLTFGFNPFFVTDVSGVGGLLLTVPVLPMGILTTFQAAIPNPVHGISLSNAVQLEIQ